MWFQLISNSKLKASETEALWNGRCLAGRNGFVKRCLAEKLANFDLFTLDFGVLTYI